MDLMLMITIVIHDMNTIFQIPTISLNKYDIRSNIEQPIPSQEINPSSKYIHQTRCAISLINTLQPCIKYYANITNYEPVLNFSRSASYQLYNKP